jgi:hypothetical protein
MNLRSSLRTLALASICALPLPAGVVTINFTETGGNVIVTASGSLTDATAWGYFSSDSPPSFIDPSSGDVVFGGSGDGYAPVGSTTGSWTSGFGGGSIFNASSSSGDTFGFGTASNVLLVPSRYIFSSVNPTSLSSTMTFNSATFLSLGITTGSYVFNNGGDTIQLTFGGGGGSGGGSSVPDAGPGPALALLLGGLGLRQWHSSRRSRAAA